MVNSVQVLVIQASANMAPTVWTTTNVHLVINVDVPICTMEITVNTPQKHVMKNGGDIVSVDRVNAMQKEDLIRIVIRLQESAIVR